MKDEPRNQSERQDVLSLQTQVRFWIAALAALIGLLWLFSDILLPFVAGMALAYLLDPVADRLEKFGLPRLVATLVILGGSLGAFGTEADAKLDARLIQIALAVLYVAAAYTVVDTFRKREPAAAVA